MKVPDYTFDKGRLAALDAYSILDTPASPGFDDIVLLATQICEAPVALVSFVAGNRQWFKARIGFEPCETDLDSSVCAHALVMDDLLIITDLAQDERTRSNPLVTGEPHIRFYAGAPLRTSGGDVIGSLCVIDGKPRPGGLTETQSSGLRNLARQVMSQLELVKTIAERDRAIALRQSQERLRQATEAQYKTLFEAIDEGFCVIEMKFLEGVPKDYRFVELNPAFALQTGLENARGKWMRELAPNHEQYWFDLYGKVALTGEPVRFEQVANELNGRWYEVQAFRVDNPALHRVGILFSDKTDRKASEALKEAAEDARDMLAIELNHRMKNTFAMVQAIALQTLRSVPDRRPVEAFTKRIQALSTAHDILLKESWTATHMSEVARATLSTLCEAKRFDISGPDIKLGPRATLSVSLMLHELGTNALKYGALSTETGRVAIGWRVAGDAEDEALTLDWHESGGPPVEAPSKRGFGSKLIEMGLIGAGGATIRYLAGGLEAEFIAPLTEVRDL